MGGGRHPLEGCWQKAQLSFLSEVPTMALAYHLQKGGPVKKQDGEEWKTAHEQLSPIDCFGSNRDPISEECDA